MSHGITEKDTMISVRSMPWHGLGTVLDDYPEDIDDALERAGLTWAVNQGDVFVARPVTQDEGILVPQMEARLIAAEEFKANIREDTGDVLGIVSKDYKVVPNRDAFAWLDALLGGDIEIETAGSLQSGRRVWVLAKIPKYTEVGGDEMGEFVYCANSHDGSMAVTAAATQVRVVCANTLGAALRRSEGCERTYKFRHTGDMQEKLGEARRVMQISLDWNAAFADLGNKLATKPMAKDGLGKIVDKLTGADNPDLGDRAKQNRADIKEVVLNIYDGKGPEGDTSGNSPGTAWAAYNAVAEWADWGRRVTKRTDQMQRSFEDQRIKDGALEKIRQAVGV